MMKNRNISKKELVESTRISWRTMCRINKEEHVALEVIDKICEAFHCQFNDVIEYVNDPDSPVNLVSAEEQN